MDNSLFITNNFLLENHYSRELYNKFSKDHPIIDYHNHLSPKDIAQDRKYSNITELWLAGDHAKYRAMRCYGISEDYITGQASDKEKFLTWAKTVPKTIRNPIYHWTHLELKRYFGIEKLLNQKTAEDIYEEVNYQLQKPENSCQGFLNKSNVESLCTTEDPLDDLKYHKQHVSSNSKVKVSTSFRPDKAISIESESYLTYINKLSDTSNIEISTYYDLQDALRKRVEYFHANGCRLSDHGLTYMPFEISSDSNIDKIFRDKLKGKILSGNDIDKFKTAILLYLAEIYHEFGWVQQFHLGAQRNNNSRMFKKLGPDSGWDSIGDFKHSRALSFFLNALDKENKLSKTLLYNLNPSDNAVFASMVGNFNDGSVKGKIQYGSAWWFLDQKEGIINQLNTLSNMGLLSCFVGMLTDSRSFLSMSRHEYFRRILCNLLGNEMVSGDLPKDLDLIGETISEISYFNAKEYFDL
ncbi:glucuronate isomerase [Salegentibacter salegens]|uniref:Uronate isomerase n=1 Tax=Salegentibacter salegens TaxID=143223 RepID=A0A1M7ME87_9FLAO|nr:glucuronate isomerase [Salegentibacter salegens]PRX51641.1 glucuronate isomerase [Salegentibacter salegens]SHM89165.1 glucuronate isomerase [Salegentibacter salegens]